MAWQHDVAGGQGDLIATSLQSPNFETGVQGWQVRKDGSVEFNNGIFRGYIVGGSLFIYVGTPALGNPPVTWITSATADPFGNAVQPGVFLGQGAAGNALAGLIWNTIVGSEPLLALFPDSTLQFAGNSPYILGRVWDRGLPSESVSLALGGGAASNTSSPVMLELYGRSKDGTSRIPNTQVYSPGGAGWTVGGSQTDATNRTINSNNTFAAITPTWTIPANDAQVGTVYRMTAFGAGTQVAAQPNFFLEVDGFNATGRALAEIAGSNIFIGGLSLIAEAWITILSTGAAGTAMFSSRLTISGNGQASTSSESLVATGRTVNAAIDTTAAYGVLMLSAINTATGANANWECSMLERIGP